MSGRVPFYSVPSVADQALGQSFRMNAPSSWILPDAAESRGHRAHPVPVDPIPSLPPLPPLPDTATVGTTRSAFDAGVATAAVGGPGSSVLPIPPSHSGVGTDDGSSDGTEHESPRSIPPLEAVGTAVTSRWNGPPNGPPVMGEDEGPAALPFPTTIPSVDDSVDTCPPDLVQAAERVFREQKMASERAKSFRAFKQHLQATMKSRRRATVRCDGRVGVMVSPFRRAPFNAKTLRHALDKVFELDEADWQDIDAAVTQSRQELGKRSKPTIKIFPVDSTALQRALQSGGQLV